MPESSFTPNRQVEKSTIDYYQSQKIDRVQISKEIRLKPRKRLESLFVYFGLRCVMFVDDLNDLDMY